LLIDDQGFLVLNNVVDSGYTDDGIFCNALIWLMSKLINFMAAGDEVPTEMGMGFAGGIPQSTLLDYWYHLRTQFQAWHDSLPLTFKPSSRVEPTLAPGRHLRGENEALFPEVWYNIPMCASTMQAYHMSQIHLFMNKPHESTQGRRPSVHASTRTSQFSLLARSTAARLLAFHSLSQTMLHASFPSRPSSLLASASAMPASVKLFSTSSAMSKQMLATLLDTELASSPSNGSGRPLSRMRLSLERCFQLPGGSFEIFLQL
jgi:hypothetical protein